MRLALNLQVDHLAKSHILLLLRSLQLFEVMTLQQCGKIKVKFPIILFGKSYWQKVSVSKLQPPADTSLRSLLALLVAGRKLGISCRKWDHCTGGRRLFVLY